MAKFEYAEGEEELGSWTVNYRPPWKGRYTGKLFVTNQRLLYDAKFDTSVSGVLVDLVTLYVGGSEGYLSIPRERIRNVAMAGRSKVTVTLDDDSVHTFDYGALLSAKKIYSAIAQ